MNSGIKLTDELVRGAVSQPHVLARWNFAFKFWHMISCLDSRALGDALIPLPNIGEIGQGYFLPFIA